MLTVADNIAPECTQIISGILKLTKPASEHGVPVQADTSLHVRWPFSSQPNQEAAFLKKNSGFTATIVIKVKLLQGLNHVSK